MATEQQYDTQHGAGDTYDPEEAQEQGLSYTPPSDPPVRPSDDPEGAEIAAGFAPNMEGSSPDTRDLPEGVDNNDLELANDVEVALRNNSETAELVEDIMIDVQDGRVTIEGAVTTEDDVGRIYDIIIELAGVRDVQSDLDVAG